MEGFYEKLVLLSVLVRSQGQRHMPRRKGWHRCLDDLSYLCDSRPGGSTTLSVAAEDDVGRLRFWMFAQQKTEKARGHLEWILDKISTLYGKSQVEASAIETDILERSAFVACRKIRHYETWLRVTMERAKTTESAGSAAGKSVLEYLARTLVDHTSYPSLCSEMHRFSQTSSYLSLKTVIETAATSDAKPWIHIRHYVGRLAAVSKAAKFLALWSTQHRTFEKPYEVSVISGIEAFPKSLNAAATDLVASLRQTLPAFDIEQALDSATDTQGESLSSKFAAKFNDPNFQPLVHAEIAVLEYFNMNGLKFFEDDRYIGCSKPSCYCCQLYVSSHPMNINPRPHHCNVWTKWSPPILHAHRHRLHETLEGRAMKALTRQLERDILHNLVSGDYTKARSLGFDSITDLSLSYPVV